MEEAMVGSSFMRVSLNFIGRQLSFFVEKTKCTNNTNGSVRNTKMATLRLCDVGDEREEDGTTTINCDIGTGV